MSRGAATWIVVLSLALPVGTYFWGVMAANADFEAQKAHTAAENDKADFDAAQTAKQAAADAEQRLAEQKAAADKAAQAAGFSPSPTADGLVFWKGVTGHQCSLYAVTCGHVLIAVSSSCTPGVYVAANLDEGSTVIGHGNAITGALDPQHGTEVEIDFPGAPDDPAAKWELTDAHSL